MASGSSSSSRVWIVAALGVVAIVVVGFLAYRFGFGDGGKKYAHISGFAW